MKNALCLALLALPLLTPRAQAQEAPASLSDLLPPRTVLTVETRDAGALFRQIWDAPPRRALAEGPSWRRFAESEEGRNLVMAQGFLQTQLGEPWHEALPRLLAGPVVLAFVHTPGERPPGALVLARPRHPERLQTILGALRVFLPPAVEYTEHRGVAIEVRRGVVSFQEAGLFGFARDFHHLEGVIDRWKDGAAPSGGGSERFADGGSVRAFLDLEYVRDHAPKFPKTRAIPQPFLNLLLGGVYAQIQSARSVRASLDLDDAGPRLRVRAEPLNRSGPLKSYFSGDAVEGIPDPPETIASLALRRDLAAWWEQRLELVDELGHAALTRFTRDIGNLIGGGDLGEEILAGLGSAQQLLVIAPEASPSGPVPEPLLPGFVLSFETAGGESHAARIQALFQSIVSFANIEATRAGRAPLIITSEEYRGVKLTRARPMAPDTGGPVGIEGNFVPTLGLAHGRLLLGSHDHAVKRIIDTLEATGPVTLGALDQARLNVGRLRDLLHRNEGALIASALLEGKPVAKAREEQLILREILSLFGTLRTRLRADGDALLWETALGYARTEDL